MRAPAFWWRDASLAGFLLAPVSAVYGKMAARAIGGGIKPGLPLMCVGNFVAGGAGKTPLAIHLARRSQACGKEVVFLTRGYGGKYNGPHLVSSGHDQASQVGDEPLLLAKYAPTIVSKDRVAGLRYIETVLAPDLIIMDDGFQSARIKPDFSMLVIDGEMGLGNGKVIPAGPLRAPLHRQCSHGDGLVVMQTKEALHTTMRRVIDAFQRKNAPIFFARPTPMTGHHLENQRVVAFCGIGRPQKFFDTLSVLGCDLVSTNPFADHHFFCEADAAHLLEQARMFDAKLVTTAKDAIRLKHHKGLRGMLFETLQIVEIELVFDQDPDPERLIEANRR